MTLKRFIEIPTEFSDLYEIKKKSLSDNRGFFERVFCVEELTCWNNRAVVQVNRTLTKKKGTIRGLHFQYPPFCEAKFVACLRGCILDVVLDLRRASKTFGKLFTIRLDAKINNGLVIPEGFAHGFQTITDEVEMLYFHSKKYSPKHESGVNVFDKELNVPWELPCSEQSQRDKTLLNFQEIEALDI